MAANQFGIDLGEAIGQAQTIKRNSLLLQKATREEDTANKLISARQRLANGDQSAMSDMLVLSPEETHQYSNAIGRMDENQRKQSEENLHQVGAMAATILHSENPEQAYQWVKTQVSPEIASTMPDQYDQNWVAYHLAAAKDGMTLLGKMTGPPTKITVGTEDVVYDKNGKEIARTKSGEQVRHDKAQSQRAGELKSADESLINKEVSQTFGGIYNPMTGEVKFSDPQAGQKAQQITADAVKIYQNGGGRISRSEAVRQAMSTKQTPKPNALKPFMP